MTARRRTNAIFNPWARSPFTFPKQTVQAEREFVADNRTASRMRIGRNGEVCFIVFTDSASY